MEEGRVGRMTRCIILHQASPFASGSVAGWPKEVVKILMILRQTRRIIHFSDGTHT